MKVRMRKDWSWHKAGEIVEVWEATGRNWLLNEIADPYRESEDARSLASDRQDVVEDTRAVAPGGVERAERRPKHRR